MPVRLRAQYLKHLPNTFKDHLCAANLGRATLPDCGVVVCVQERDGCKRKPCDLCRRQKPVLSRELAVAIVDIRTTLTTFGSGKYIRIIDRVICSTRIERTMVETLKHTIKVRRNGMHNCPPSLHPSPYDAEPRYHCTHALAVLTTSRNVRPDTAYLPHRKSLTYRERSQRRTWPALGAPMYRPLAFLYCSLLAKRC